MLENAINWEQMQHPIKSSSNQRSGRTPVSVVVASDDGGGIGGCSNGTESVVVMAADSRRRNAALGSDRRRADDFPMRGDDSAVTPTAVVAVIDAVASVLPNVAVAVVLLVILVLLDKDESFSMAAAAAEVATTTGASLFSTCSMSLPFSAPSFIVFRAFFRLAAQLSDAESIVTPLLSAIGFGWFPWLLLPSSW